jgi:hypothetical protein
MSSEDVLVGTAGKDLSSHETFPLEEVINQMRILHELMDEIKY